MDSTSIVRRQLEAISPFAALAVGLLLLALGLLTLRLYRPAPPAGQGSARAESSGAGWRLARLLRMIAYGLLAWMLLGVVQRQYAVERPELVLIVDNSRSMAQRVEAEGSESDATRWTQLESLLRDAPAEVWTNYRVVLATLDEPPAVVRDAEELSSKLKGISVDVPESPLGRRVSELLESRRGRSVAGWVLVSDTMETGQRGLSEVTSGWGEQFAPLCVAVIGVEPASRRVDVTSLDYPRRGHVGERVAVEIELRNEGLRDETIELTLIDSSTGQPLASRSVIVPAQQGGAGEGTSDPAPSTTGGPQTVRAGLTMALRRPGTLTFHLADFGGQAADSQPPSGSIEVLGSPTQVLLVDGQPRYEFRYLHGFLQRPSGPEGSGNAGFQVTSVLLSADPQWYDGPAPVLPVDADDLAPYDVVVLGDFAPSDVPTSMLGAITNWVAERGGSLVLIAGPRHMPRSFRDSPLRPLLPSAQLVDAPERWAGPTAAWSWHLTELGRGTSFAQLADDPDGNIRAWRGLAPAQWVFPLYEVGPHVQQVVMGMPVVEGAERSDAARPSPLIGWHYHGLGKVAWHATDETWRWRYRGDETLYGRYWTQLLRFLTPIAPDAAGPVELVSSRATFSTDEPVRLVARVTDPGWLESVGELNVVVAPVEPDSSGSESRGARMVESSERPMEFHAELPAMAAGTYTARIADPTAADSASCVFRVEPRRSELTQRPMSDEELRAATAATGGRVWRGDQLAELWDQLPPASATLGRQVHSRPWWNAWPVPLALLIVLAAEWYLRSELR